MAIQIIEEYIAELAKAVGDCHVAVRDGVGTEDTPGTALHEAAQLRDLTSKQLPRFGILDTAAPSFAVSVLTDLPTFVSVTTGQVGYQGARLTINTQNVSIARAFAYGYPTNYVYGVRLGFPLTEAARALQRFDTTVLADANSGDTTLEIADLDTAVSLGFPLQAFINTKYVVFTGVTSAGDALIVDPAVAGLPADFPAGTRVHLLYEPRVLSVCGLPVAPVFQASLDPAAFTYYPPLPSDWLAIADLLVTTTDPAAVAETTPGVPAIRRTVVAWPFGTTATPIFSGTDAASMLRVADNLRTALRQARDQASVGNVVRALIDYTTILASGAQLSFRSYWAQAKFRPTGYYGRGVAFDNLERFEFPDSFARAYHDTTGDDVQHTFAVFRGDLYSATSPLTGDGPLLASLHVDTFQAASVPSTLARGSYIYGVSAVTVNGETPPTYKQVSCDSATASYFVNHIWGANVTGTLFYHVYRRSTLTGDQTEYRLTDDNEITDLTVPAASGGSPSLTTTLTAHTGYAFKFTATGGTNLGGLEMQFKSSAALTNTSGQINVALYTNTGGNVPGTLIASGTAIPFSSLKTTYQTLASRLDTVLTTSTAYWIVFTFSTPPTGGTVQINTLTTGTNTYATTDNMTTWATQSGHNPWFILFAYLDNGRPGKFVTRRGVRLTGRTALKPRRLSVFVPPMEPPTIGFLPLVGVNGDTNGNETPETKNELIVTAIARLGATGAPVTLSATVPQGTARGTHFLLGTATQLYDRLDDCQVVPGGSVTLGTNNQIVWSVYDLVTVETEP